MHEADGSIGEKDSGQNEEISDEMLFNTHSIIYEYEEDLLLSNQTGPG